MSLSKQLYMIISFIFFMIFAGNFVISVKNTKEYLEVESTTKAQDTATGLGMTLKSLMGNKKDPEIVSIINAIANRGFYKEIRLEDVSFSFSEEALLNSSNLMGEGWEISDIKVDGRVGTIEPLGQEGELGKQLALLENETIDPFDEKKDSLKYIFKPAKNFKDGSDIDITFKASKGEKTVESKATVNISKILVKVSRAEKFEYVPQWFIDLVPLRLSEMKSEISNGWNTTAIIYVSANAGDAYAKLYEQAKGAIIYAIVAFLISIALLVIFLQLRQTFETDMKKMFISKDEGFVFSIKIDDLGEFAKTHTNKETDKFLIEFSKILSSLSNKITPYRFFGSEFAMIAKGMKLDELKSIVDKLKKDLGELSVKIHKKEIAHIGVTPFNPIGTIPGIVASAHEAYEKAKLIGPNEAHIRDDSDLARDMEEWKSLVFDIIDNNKFEVSFIGQAYGLSDENQKTLLMEEAFTQARDNEGEDIPIGTFVSIAEKYGKILEFDKGVVSKVIDHINSSKISHSISINLSLDSVVNLSFRRWLKEKIENNEDISSQLVFSVTAYGVAKDVEEFKNFIEDVHSVGAKVIIKRFETKFIPLDHIKDFNLDYIRLARDYTNGISKDSSKKGFVESMQELSALLNIKLLAENVKEDSDHEVVRSLGLYGASR